MSEDRTEATSDVDPATSDADPATSDADDTDESGSAGGSSGDVTVEHRSAEEAFALLGNETRIGILRALAASPGEPLSFSELQDRVAVRDSGQFNYHLGKLAGHFVRSGDEGYELTTAGKEVVGAIRAGTYTADTSIDPIELDDPCPRCEGTLAADYEDEYVHIRCPDCSEWSTRFSFPPGTVEQFERDALPEAFDRWLHTRVARTVAGFCPRCSGRLNARLRPDEDHPDGVAAAYTCDRCGPVAQIDVRGVVLAHAGAIGFYHDHGIDPATTPTWEIDRQSDIEVELLDCDPPRARIEIAVDDECLVATVDEAASVASVERRGA